MDRIVIIGAGQAGGWAARTLRKEGFAGSVVLIGEEAHPPHERPPLSKAVLVGEAPPESTHLMKAEALEELALDLRRKARGTSIDRGTKQVSLADGSSVGYDRLILCTGGRPRKLDVPGADLPGVFTLRTIEDALGLAPMLEPGKTVVVVGGGWIGLEAAAAARKKGADATVVEIASRLCERTVPPEVSEYLLAMHKDRGADVLLGTGVVAFAATPDSRLVVTLSSGQELACDAV